MTKDVICLTLCAVLFALCAAADAQQTTKIPRIGYLTPASPSGITIRQEAFRQGLRELGYLEGKNIIIEYRYAEGSQDRLMELAAELVRLKVDIIVTTSSLPTRAAKAASPTIPIIMLQDNDPVGNGFVASLARPGGNITGLAALDPELSGKRLELLKETVPKLSRVAVLGDSTIPGSAQVLKETELAAAAFKGKIQYLDVGSPKDIEQAFRAAEKEHADGILTMTSPVLFSHRPQLVELSVKHRFPAIYHQSQYVESGGLMSYGASFTDMDRRAAIYVDKILKGAKPADLPVEQPTKFELIINLNAAKRVGLTIPPNVLARADRVIR
ncbi:MAG TPA: ABC transporter substrate-binding protein [Candidatus Binatia bacterium]|jgi:putative ABC transport system substrate-binding protein